MAESKWTVQSLREVAEFFGVSYTTVRKDWRANGTVPEEKPKDGYDLRQITKNHVEQQVKVAQRTGSPNNELRDRKTGHQASKAAEEVRKIRRENDLAEGLLLSRDEVERYLVQWAIRFRTPLMRLPDKVASRVPGSMKAAVKAEVADDVRAALKMVRDQRLTESTIGKLIVAEAKRIKAEK